MFEDGQLVKITKYTGEPVYAMVINKAKEECCYNLITENGIFLPELEKYISVAYDLPGSRKNSITAKIIARLTSYNMAKEEKGT